MTLKSLLITILVSVACGFAANLGTPFLRTLWFKGAFSTRRARIKRLTTEIEFIQSYSTNPSALNLWLFREMFRAASWIALGTAVFMVNVATPPPPIISKWVLRLPIMILAFGAGRLSSNISTVKSLLNPDSHIRDLQARLTQLENKVLSNKPGDGQ